MGLGLRVGGIKYQVSGVKYQVSSTKYKDRGWYYYYTLDSISFPRRGKGRKGANSRPQPTPKQLVA